MKGEWRSQQGQDAHGPGDISILRWLAQPFRKMGYHHLLILLVLIIAGSTLRVWGAMDSDLVIDEATKVSSVESYREGRFWVNLEHPPLEKYLIFASISIFGTEDIWIKLPNVILGCLTPILVFILVSKVGKGTWPGLIGASISSLSPVLIGYSMIAKEDTLSNFLSLLTILFLLMILEREMGNGNTMSERRRASITSKRREIRSSPEGHVLLSRFDPRSLDRAEIGLGIIIGLSIASKYTFLFLLLILAVFLFILKRNMLVDKGPRIMAVALLVFIVISWYYLNPVWLSKGIYHWMVESVGGHLTFFMGRSYQYPPPWFYVVVLFGRVHPLVLFSSVGYAVAAFWGLFMALRTDHSFDNDSGHKERRVRLDAMGKYMQKDPGPWILLFWGVGMFIIMTVLPFKGVRYIQWIIIPMISLSAIGLWSIMAPIKERARGPLALFMVTVLMTSSVALAAPHYTEWSYILNEGSGVRDYNGQGHREALEWIASNGGGKVSMRWTELGEHYHDNVTGPVLSIDEVREENVSFIILYLYDLQREVHPEMTEIATSTAGTLAYEVVHRDVTVLWVYRTNT
jgi:4-amino-4-deoxy-L-arabinose transferase-like glycosyltransferase